MHGPKFSSTECTALYAVDGIKKYRGRRGRYTTNLLDILKADMKERDLNLHNTSGLELLRSAAADRARWREMAKKDRLQHQ